MIITLLLSSSCLFNCDEDDYFYVEGEEENILSLNDSIFYLSDNQIDSFILINKSYDFEEIADGAGFCNNVDYYEVISYRFDYLNDLSLSCGYSYFEVNHTFIEWMDCHLGYIKEELSTFQLGDSIYQDVLHYYRDTIYVTLNINEL